MMNLNLTPFVLQSIIGGFGILGITPTQNCTHFLKIGFVVAKGGFYSYYIHQGNESDKERKILRKKLGFMHTKRFYTFFKRWVQFRAGAIPRLPRIHEGNSLAHLKLYNIF